MFKRHLSSKFLFVAALLTMPLAGAQPVVAEQNDGYTKSMSTRYTIAGRQRMLSEGMANALCLSRLGVEAEANSSDLYVMRNVFNWYHLGINGGNSGLELEAENNPQIRRKWQRVDRIWQELATQYDLVLEGAYIPKSDFNDILEQTAVLSRLNNSLVVSFRSVYEDEIGSSGLGSALLIDLYERQRMLGKKLSKEICLIAAGRNNEDLRANVSETLSIFENSLQAFRVGMPSLGVPAAPSTEIKEQLELVAESWEIAQPIARAVAGGSAPSLENMVALHNTMERVTGQMTIAIQHLVDFEEQK